MRPFVLLAILLFLQLAACAETPERKAAIEEMERRQILVMETSTGGM
jgi:hypothetical protein